MSFEDQIRKIVREELQENKNPELLSVDAFCKKFGVSRTTVWRQALQGSLQTKSIGKRKFIVTP